MKDLDIFSIISEKNEKFNKINESFKSEDIPSVYKKIVNIVSKKTDIKFYPEIHQYYYVKYKHRGNAWSFITYDLNNNWISISSTVKDDNPKSSELVGIELWIDNDEKRFLNNVKPDVFIDIKGANINQIVYSCIQFFNNKNISELYNLSYKDLMSKNTEAKSVIKYKGKEKTFQSKKNAIEFIYENIIEDDDKDELMGKIEDESIYKPYVDVINKIYDILKKNNIKVSDKKTIRKPLKELTKIPTQDNSEEREESVSELDKSTNISDKENVKQLEEATNDVENMKFNISKKFENLDFNNKRFLSTYINNKDDIKKFNNIELHNENKDIIEDHYKVVNGDIKSFIIYGTSGIGKSYGLNELLSNIKYNDKTNEILFDPSEDNIYGFKEKNILKGLSKNKDYIKKNIDTSSGLIKQLFLDNDKIIILDDGADALISDDKSISILRSAADLSGHVSKVTASKSSYYPNDIDLYENIKIIEEQYLKTIDENTNNNNDKNDKEIIEKMETLKKMINDNWFTKDQLDLLEKISILDKNDRNTDNLKEYLQLTHNQMIDLYNNKYNNIVEVILNKKIKSPFPNEFYFNGIIIIITNKNIDNILNKKKGTNENLSALITRSISVNVFLTLDEIIQRIQMLFENNDFEFDVNEGNNMEIAKMLLIFFADKSENGFIQRYKKESNQPDISFGIKQFVYAFGFAKGQKKIGASDEYIKNRIIQDL